MKGSVIVQHRGREVVRANINSRWHWRELTGCWKKIYGQKYNEMVLVVTLVERKHLTYDKHGCNCAPPANLKKFHA